MQVNSEEELQSTLVNNLSGEFLAPRDIEEFLQNDQLYNRPSSFESIEVTSAPNTSGMGPLVFEKEDYIEMDDLLIPEVGISSTDKPAQFSNNGELGDVNDFDQLFHDVSMSLDMEPVAQGTSSSPSSLSNFVDNTSDQKQQSLYQQFQDQTPENQLNNIIDTSLNQFTDDMWFHDDDQAVLLDQQQSVSGAFASPSSGT